MAEKTTRMTRQRKLILEELRRMKSHPTADEIYSMVREKLPRISLGTVYRNLQLLTGPGCDSIHTIIQWTNEIRWRYGRSFSHPL